MKSDPIQPIKIRATAFFIYKFWCHWAVILKILLQLAPAMWLVVANCHLVSCRVSINDYLLAGQNHQGKESARASFGEPSLFWHWLHLHLFHREASTMPQSVPIRTLVIHPLHAFFSFSWRIQSLVGWTLDSYILTATWSDHSHGCSVQFQWFILIVSMAPSIPLAPRH